MSVLTVPSNAIRIACAQLSPAPGDISTNAARAALAVEAAAERGACVMAFPEKFLTGYEPGLIAADPERYCLSGSSDPRLDPIARACATHNVTAVIGAATRIDGVLRISSVVADPDGQMQIPYHKRCLFHEERGMYTPGDHSAVLEIDGWRIGLSICYDAGFPEHARALALDNCHLYLVSSLFSKVVGLHESRIWLPARALDNTIFVGMCNFVGVTGGWETCGRSAVWAPLGTVIAEASADEEEVLICDLDPRQFDKARSLEHMLEDVRKSGLI